MAGGASLSRPTGYGLRRAEDKSWQTIKDLPTLSKV